MEPRTILNLVCVFAILFGAYIILASVKNWHKNHSHRRLKARIVQYVLGVDGARVFYGIIGAGMILFGLVVLFQMHVKPLLGEKINNKTDQITLSLIMPNASADYEMTVSEITNFARLKENVRIMGEEQLLKYSTISLRDNYLKEIPEMVWKMENLKSLDLTNNEIESISIQNLQRLPKLESIILDGNHISEENLREIREFNDQLSVRMVKSVKE